jgi:hypothetical protein
MMPPPFSFYREAANNPPYRADHDIDDERKDKRLG